MNDLPEITTNGGTTELDTEDYLRGVKSSTCLLLPATPSPTPLDFKHPLQEEVTEAPFLTMNGQPDMDTLQNSDASAGDSSSSGDSNSVVQDPVSAQLINNISMLDYQTLSKNGNLIMGEAEDCKLNGNLNFANRKLPGFVNWNWPLIRKFLLWIVISGLVACTGVIIAMVVTIPKTCNPELPWYQGKVLYELFPGSFHDSNHDGTGDLKGIIEKLDYIHELGASAIRLNSIFEANNYPEQYYNVKSLMNIAKDVGDIDDFQNLVKALKAKDMSLVLDLPILSMPSNAAASNSSYVVLFANENKTAIYSDQTSAALAYWSRVQNVNGFYLKNLEDYVHDPNFCKSLQHWKQIIGSGKILIASENAYKNAEGNNLNTLLTNIDLIDVHLSLDHGINFLKVQIENITSGTLWANPQHPWVHWNIGNINSERISTQHLNNTLALTALEFILPGTVSIFYGDEIGLGNLPNLEKTIHEHAHVHNLVPMMFSENNNHNMPILPGNSNSEPQYHFWKVIKSLIDVRLSTPTIYLRGITKEGNLLKNMEIRKAEENLVVIERWYPRRNTCVFVGNLGNASISTDLSTMFYGGTVVAGTNTSLIGQVIYFDQVTFPPNSAIILKLEK